MPDSTEGSRVIRLGRASIHVGRAVFQNHHRARAAQGVARIDPRG